MIKHTCNLDEVDKMIIEELIEDSRISYSDIAEKVHLSRVSVRERVLKLKESGVIDRFTIVVSSKDIGLKTSVFFDVETAPNKIDAVGKALAEYDEITIVYQNTGATSLHVHAMLENIESISGFMHEKLYPIEGIINVNSHLLLKRYKSVLTYV